MPSSTLSSNSTSNSSASFDASDAASTGEAIAATDAENSWSSFAGRNDFISRHIGPGAEQQQAMLELVGAKSLENLIEQAVPENIRSETTAILDGAYTEQEALKELQSLAQQNQIFQSFIGLGYYPTYTPPVILRNVLQNPGWYTAYTPYQPEISQGRLEALLNFQQMIIELSGMDIANASMLDEATAAAEAMAMAKRVNRKNKSSRFLVDAEVFPQTLAVLKTRAEFFNFELELVDFSKKIESEFFAAYIQHPSSTGALRELASVVKNIHEKNALAIVGADIMSLVLLEAPGEAGADIVVGSNQRFGIPMGFGGPHAAFFAFRDEYKRSAPGRIIGVSIDRRGKRALRMAMQTREQHIRREKANSNICTSQVLLALMSAFYAMYHGPEGLKRIAQGIHHLSKTLKLGLEKAGYKIVHDQFFDTLLVDVGDNQKALIERAQSKQINLRTHKQGFIAISLHECATLENVNSLINIFANGRHPFSLQVLDERASSLNCMADAFIRKQPALQHEIFSQYRSETLMLRYLKRLENRDIALNHAMIPLGSCTMKLNATAEMIPVTWPEFGNLHPFAPPDQAKGYLELFKQLKHMLEACTGYDDMSLQPNAGSQGEYAGLVAIRKYFAARGETQRTICLIPQSAHGTNPASAHMAGLDVVVTLCNEQGDVDIEDLRAKIDKYGDSIAALMITYPSTHGVYEEGVTEVCKLIHSIGAQVYLDGANMNALVGVAAPGKFGADVSHLNLHKTFCIPHGGGGPGMGPIGVKAHLAPYLPSHPLQNIEGTAINNGVISAAPWGSASILTISWMYIRMMGAQGLKQATQLAILNANYIAKRLGNHFPILYRGKNGMIAHECLLDLRPLKESSGITEEDIAKRLMDYGFHAPTMSFPVPGTLMIEPTESEDRTELDRFCDAMIAIREEINRVQSGEWPADDNPLRMAPHTLDDVLGDWEHPYDRETAVRPLDYLKHHKYWPYVNRIDNVYGDRNLMCSCPPLENYSEEVLVQHPN